jgi:methylase of polypeptide subunit release factors
VNPQISKQKKEFGDFQTPISLANAILTKLKGDGLSPRSILEPTCGTGSFIITALNIFPSSEIHGFDINSKYITDLKIKISKLNETNHVSINVVNFFDVNWSEYLKKIPSPFLIVGNLPWVTSSELGKINGKNIPEKSNIHEFKGLDSLTGKSNFDISEWMILKLLKAMNGSSSTLAILCKVSVARKIFKYIIKANFPISSFIITEIDTELNFNASVDACLLTVTLQKEKSTEKCLVYSSLDSQTPITTLSIFNDNIINDHATYEKLKHLHGKSSLIWRSGIKHDAVKIMELIHDEKSYRNGFNEVVDIEGNYLFPLIKSSDLAHGRVKNSSRALIVPQKIIGEETSILQSSAPKLWKYLNLHRNHFDNRASSIYKTKPPFSIFGIGSYSFSLWKIAISGFHKKIQFQFIGPIENKPVVFDDTCYFLPATCMEEALIWFTMFTHPKVIKFFNSLIYWKAKRPITKQILQQVNLQQLFLEMGEEYIRQSISSIKSPPVNQIIMNKLIQNPFSSPNS